MVGSPPPPPGINIKPIDVTFEVVILLVTIFAPTLVKTLGVYTDPFCKMFPVKLRSPAMSRV